MTAILALNLGDRVVMLSDTAWLGPTGIVQIFKPKMFVVCGGRAVIAMQGPGYFDHLVSRLDREGRCFCDVDDLWARLGAELREQHRLVSAVDAWWEGVDYTHFFRGVVASMDDSGPRIGIIHGDIPDLKSRGFELHDIASGEGIDGWMRAWASFQPIARETVQWAFSRHLTGSPDFLAERDALPMFEKARLEEFYGGHHGVGGDVEEIVITREGASKRVVHGWNDRCFRKIDPTRNAPRSMRMVAIGIDDGVPLLAVGPQSMPKSYLDTDTSLAANSDSKVASQKATKAYVDGIVAANDAMVFKGVIDCSSNPNYPAADRGHTYRVSVAGKIGGGSGINVEVGDILLCLTDSTSSGDQATVGSAWTVIQSNIDGAVVGPASATDSYFAQFDGTTGKLIKAVSPVSATAALSAVVGDSGSGGTKGLVPAPAIGDAAAGKFLKADGTWAEPSAAGITQITAQSASGSAVTVGSLPSTMNELTILLLNLSPTSTATFKVLLHAGGSYVSSGYDFSGSISTTAITTGNATDAIYPAGNPGTTVVAANAISVIIRLVRMQGTNTWLIELRGHFDGGTSQTWGAGYIALGSALDGFEVTTSAGTFDAGTVGGNYQ